MTVTIKSMLAGLGVEYLLRTVAAGDGDRSLGHPLTRYYTVAHAQRHPAASLDSRRVGFRIRAPRRRRISDTVTGSGRQSLGDEGNLVAAAFSRRDADEDRTAGSRSGDRSHGP